MESLWCSFSPPATCESLRRSFDLRLTVCPSISSWLGPKDISKLLPHEIESYINDPVKKSGDLLAGYRIALDPTEWEAKRPQLPTADEDEDADADADGEEDELASEPSEGKRKRKPAAAKKSGKKSKKPVEAESEDEGAPPAKKAKKSKKDDGAKKGKDEDAEGEIDADEAPKSQAEEVRDWRHKLQKTFLGHKAVPKETVSVNLLCFSAVLFPHCTTFA